MDVNSTPVPFVGAETHPSSVNGSDSVPVIVPLGCGITVGGLGSVDLSLHVAEPSSSSNGKATVRTPRVRSTATRTSGLEQSVADETSESAPSSNKSGRSWVRGLSLLFCVSVVGGTIMNWSNVRLAARQLTTISPAMAIMLVGLLLLHKGCHTAMQRASVTGPAEVSFIQMAIATEAFVGAANSIVGGGGIGTGLRAAMLRSWGVKPRHIAVSVLGASVAPSFAMWSLAFCHTWPRVIRGDSTQMERLVALASIGFLAVPGTFWWLALRRPPVFAAVSRRIHGLRDRVLARFPESRIAKSSLAKANLESHIEDVRVHGREMVRTRGVLMFFAALAGQLLMATILLACVRALGAPTQDINALEIYRAFALLRVMSSFVPIPGGLGVLDLGLLGVLSAGGVDRPIGMAAIALYRGLTFFLPMVSGAMCAALWRSQQRSRCHGRTETGDRVRSEPADLSAFPDSLAVAAA